jgi:hypothetical protein
MPGNNLLAYENTMLLLAPQDIAGTATSSAYVNLANCNDAMLFVAVGNITTATASQTAGPVVTVEAATSGASSSAEANYEFTYRLSGALNSNTWTAPASATAGVDLTVTGDNKILAIKIDPCAISALCDGYDYVRVTITPGAEGAITLAAAWAVLDVKYKQTTYTTAT